MNCHVAIFHFHCNVILFTLSNKAVFKCFL